MFQNFGLRFGVSNMSDKKVFKEVGATKGEPWKLVNFMSDWLNSTIDGLDRYRPITLEI